MLLTTALCRAGLIAAAGLTFWVDGARADGWYMAVDLGGGVTDDPSGSDGFTTELTPGIAGGMAFDGATLPCGALAFRRGAKLTLSALLVEATSRRVRSNRPAR